MGISSRTARPLLASIFVLGGADAVGRPAGKLQAAESVLGPLRAGLPGIPSDNEVVVRANGAVQVGAGLMLASGQLRRLSALVLVGSLIPTTVAGHRFWEEPEDAARAQQRIHFLKNLGILGGLLLAATDLQGAPSLGWRARRSARSMSARWAGVHPRPAGLKG